MKQAGFAPVLIILVLAVITSLGGFLAYQNYRARLSPTLTPKQTTQPSPSPKQIEEATDSAETANWKTYTNEEYGFEIRYPIDLITSSELQVQYQTGVAIINEKTIRLITIREPVKDAHEEQLVFHMEVHFINKQFDLFSQQHYDMVFKEQEDGFKRDVNIAGLHEKGIKTIGVFSGDPPWGYYVLYVGLNNGKTLAILHRSPFMEGLEEKRKYYLSIYNQILSTFKFTE